MNMLATPLAVRFIGLSDQRVKEAIKTQKQIFKKLNALAPSRHQKDKLDLGEWFTKNILLSEEDRQQRNTLFLGAQELCANNRGMVEAIHQYVKEGGKEKPPLEIQEAMYFFWNGGHQKAQEMIFQEELSEPVIAAQAPLPEQEIEAQKPLSEQELEGQEALPEPRIEIQNALSDLANTNLALKQKIKRPRFTPETMGLVARAKQAQENVVAQANKPKSSVEKTLTSPMFVSTTSGVIGGLTGLIHQFITIGLLTSTPFLVSGIPIIAGIVGLFLILGFAYFSVQYNAKTEYARKLDKDFFSPLIESLDAMLDEILANTQTTISLQHVSLKQGDEIKQDMRTGVAAINETRDDISRGFQSIKEEIINAPRQIINNYFIVDPGFLPFEQPGHLQGKIAARETGYSALHPTITLSQEGQESAEILLDNPQQNQDVIIENHTRRVRKVSWGSVTSSSSSVSASPIIGRSPTPENEDEGRALFQGQASSLFKGKGRVEDYVVMSRSEVEALKRKANVQPVEDEQIDSDDNLSEISLSDIKDDELSDLEAEFFDAENSSPQEKEPSLEKSKNRDMSPESIKIRKTNILMQFNNIRAENKAIKKELEQERAVKAQLKEMLQLA